jgi:hypothetical protein
VLCSRRYKDPHPVGRTAAELLERATNASFDLYRVDERFRMVRDDRLLTARGQAWVRYEADLDGDKIKGERVCVDYVHWKDFGHNVAGTWGDVWLVWRRVYKTKSEIAKRFGDKIAEKLSYSAKTAADDDKEMGEQKAGLLELWDKQRNKTCFISRDYPDLIEDGKPPINFRDFFPCPEPCYGSKTSKSLFPTPDYRYYQDQAQEIDDLTEKIANLTDFLIMRGFVPAGPSSEGSDAVRIMIQSLQDGITKNKNVFVPVESWAGFTEKGGASKLIDWLPVEKVMQALQAAVETRNQLVQDVYQITGISDILRGQTDPNETLGAQQLKSQTGARRVANSKDEVARFCRDIGQLVAEIIAEQFQPQTIADMTGYAYEPRLAPTDPAQPPMQQPPMPQGMPQAPGAPPVGAPGAAIPGMGTPAGMPPQMAAPPLQPGMPAMGQPQSPSKQTFNDEVMELLRNDRMRGFLIDIETDSTIQPDEDNEKQRRTEFVTAVGGFMKEAGQVLPAAPALAPMVSEILLFMVRGFRAGRSLEETIERAMNQLGQQLQQPKEDPKVQAEKARAEAIQAKAQADMALVQVKTQAEQQKMAMEMQKLQAEVQAMHEKLGMQREEAQIKLGTAQQQAAIDAEAQQREADMHERESAMNMMATERQHELGQESMQAKHDMSLEMMAEKQRQQQQNGVAR